MLWLQCKEQITRLILFSTSFCHTVAPLCKMYIFLDFIHKKEMFSDVYPMKLLGDAVYEIEGKMTSESTGIAEKLIGGNASAEGGAEALTEESVMQLDVIRAHRLIEIKLNKDEFKLTIKSYMSKINAHLKETNPDRVKVFKDAANPFVAKVLGSFKDWQFYMNESNDPEAALGFLNYREDGLTPFMVFFKDGFIAEKQ